MSNQVRCYRQLQIRTILFFHFLDSFSYVRKVSNYYFLSAHSVFHTLQIGFHYLYFVESSYSGPSLTF